MQWQVNAWGAHSVAKPGSEFALQSSLAPLRHDYMTVVYDMVGGHLILVETGRTSEVFAGFLRQLPAATAAEIKAAAMDMGPAYQKAVRDCLPAVDVFFDRFHVMQNYSKAIQYQRPNEYRKANRAGQALMKGTHYLLLKNAPEVSGIRSSSS